MHQRAELNQRRIIMMGVFVGLLPGADARFAGVASGEIQVESQQGRELVGQWLTGREVTQTGERAQRRPIVLRP
jgi:hypothetical protein